MEFYSPYLAPYSDISIADFFKLFFSFIFELLFWGKYSIRFEDFDTLVLMDLSSSTENQ